MSRNRDRPFSILKAVPGISRMDRLARQISDNHNVITVSYDNLRQNPEDCIRSVCNYLDLEYFSDLLNVPFARNTSFETSSPKPLMRGHILMVYMIDFVSRLLPMWLLNRILRTSDVRYPVLTLVSGTFGDLKDKLADKRDYWPS